jgi:hypothetical protein
MEASWDIPGVIIGRPLFLFFSFFFGVLLSLIPVDRARRKRGVAISFGPFCEKF